LKEANNQAAARKSSEEQKKKYQGDVMEINHNLHSAQLFFLHL
jgi:hypothetical protein